MLARLQRFTTFSLLLAALAWATWFHLQGRPVLAGLGAVFIVLGYAAFMAAEFVLLARVNRHDPAPAASLGQLVAAWWGEVTTAPAVFCWRQPFFPDEVPDDPGRPGCRGVVLVHGFVCNRGLWTPWLHQLRARGVPFIAVNLEPVFGRIDDYSAIIERAVSRIETSTGLAPVLVCHSMGGLAARAWLRDHAADDRVHRVITIGTPHHGTFLGRFGHLPNTRQMRQGNAWLQELARQEPAGRHARFTCFYGHCDNIVFPASTATLDGADNRHLPGVAHVHMAFCDEVFQEALAWTEGSSDISTGSTGGVSNAAPAAAVRTGTSAR